MPGEEERKRLIKHSDRSSEYQRRAARHKFGKIWDLFMFQHRKLIFRRLVGKTQLLESVLPGTLTACPTAKTRTLQNTTMTRDERNRCRARRTGPSSFGSIRVDWRSTNWSSSLFQREKCTGKPTRRNKSHSPSRHRSVKVAPLTAPTLSA